MQRHISRTGHPMAGMMGRWVGSMALILGLHAPNAWAAEQVKINSLSTYPEMYKMKVVQVEGTLRNYRMNHFIGNNTKLEKCIQTFSIEDETGTIGATYATLCGMGPVMLHNGDHVTIEGHFLGVLDVRLVRKH